MVELPRRDVWQQRFSVVGSHGDIYIVATKASGAWGCSCPAWKFKKTRDGFRPDCKHIRAVREGAALMVKVPTVRLDLHQGATITAGVEFRHLDLTVRAL
jgi:predicted nucleic acid-binding Zn finger protein